MERRAGGITALPAVLRAQGLVPALHQPYAHPTPASLAPCESRIVQRRSAFEYGEVYKNKTNESDGSGMMGHQPHMHSSTDTRSKQRQWLVTAVDNHRNLHSIMQVQTGRSTNGVPGKQPAAPRPGSAPRAGQSNTLTQRFNLFGKRWIEAQCRGLEDCIVSLQSPPDPG